VSIRNFIIHGLKLSEIPLIIIVAISVYLILGVCGGLWLISEYTKLGGITPIKTQNFILVILFYGPILCILYVLCGMIFEGGILAFCRFLKRIYVLITKS